MITTFKFQRLPLANSWANRVGLWKRYSAHSPGRKQNEKKKENRTIKCTRRYAVTFADTRLRNLLYILCRLNQSINQFISVVACDRVAPSIRAINY